MLKLMVNTGEVAREPQTTRHGLGGRLESVLRSLFWRGDGIDLARGQRRLLEGQANGHAQPARRRHEEASGVAVLHSRATGADPPRRLAAAVYRLRAGDPFAVRQFSEHLRSLIEREFRVANALSNPQGIFPKEGWLNRELRNLVRNHVFHGFRLQADLSRFQSGSCSCRRHPAAFHGVVGRAASCATAARVVLADAAYEGAAPRRARMGGPRRTGDGAAPAAISVVMLIVFELMRRGYRVCLSTHSTQVLDALWALHHLKENGASPSDVLAVFDAPTSRSMQTLTAAAMEKAVKIFYFDGERGASRDISDLDPASEESGDAGWGGLAEFSGRANAAVADAVANADGEGRS